MARSDEYRVTSEEVPRGRIPDWLVEHLRHQTLDSTSIEEGGPARILVIYPNENSRRQTLSSFDDDCAVDSTLHHTMDSLISTMVADLRLPRLLSNEGPFELILHEECSKQAAKLGFPMINPLPDMKWGKGKTAALSSLHSFLSSESSLSSWDGPGAGTYTKIIRKLEKNLRGTHPDMVAARIVKGLEGDDEPFTISDIDGIIMLNQAPGICQAHIGIILALSKHRPVHQLTYPGNFRLGHHGHLLLDEYPIKESSLLPSWMPRHEIESTSTTGGSVNRLLLQRENHSFDAAIDFVRKRLEANPDDRIMIIDPALETNRHRWARSLRDLGFPMPTSKVLASSNSLGHWLLYLANLSHGSDAFSLEGLRALYLQTSITVFEDSEQHPTESAVKPVADPELLTRLARSDHVLGGPGALSRWITTLSRPPMGEQDGISKESSQWWLLCVANSLRPLLSGEDRKALDEQQSRVGCHTGATLPLSSPPPTGDDWLLRTLKMIDLELEMVPSDGEGTSTAAVIQAIVRNHRNLRDMQRSTSQHCSDIGPNWVEEFTWLIQSTAVRGGGTSATGQVTIFTPRDALGCTSNLTILANLSSSSWNLKVPKIPFLGEEERHSMNLLRPDGPIRDARHHLMHLLSSAEEVVLLDPSLDDASPAAAPIREWASKNDPGDEAEILDTKPSQAVSPRDIRQSDGKLLWNMRKPSNSPLNPSSVTISIDSQMQRDRERRQPSHSIDDGYLPEEAIPQLFSIDRAHLSRKVPSEIAPPRDNHRWPVVGGLIGTGKISPTIDPRPFSPKPTGSSVSDSRHGHYAGAEQEVDIWSATRLHDWLKCPRMGWLSRGLKSRQEELQDEDLDQRTQGNLLHLVHHDMLSQTLGFAIGEERVLEGGVIRSVTRSGKNNSELMQIALESLDSRAPWLDRTDAVSTHRLRALTGMNRDQWNSWLADPKPIPPAGRIGTIVRAEENIGDSAPLSLEWSIEERSTGGVEISLPVELTGGKELPPIRVRGYIDRVDLLPHDEEGEIWLDAGGDQSVAPIRIHNSGWKPRRLVAIRDLKTSESKSASERHSNGLLDELQLALYARSWEITHPGDLVVGAGISLFGHHSEHVIELSGWFTKSHQQINIGTRTDITANLYRFTDEKPSPDSDHFRAWLAHRLSVALRVASRASSGKVHPTPSKPVCRYCPVSNTCQVREEDDY